MHPGRVRLGQERHPARHDAPAAARRARIEGAIRVDGHDVLALDKRGLRELRGGLVSMIFQEPMTALDPGLHDRRTDRRDGERHKGGSRAAARARALELLELVKIP